jgi:membrane protease YdiL (CAAX protease family)
MAAVVAGRGGVARLLGQLIPTRPGVIAWCVLAIVGPLLAFATAAALACRGSPIPGWDAYVHQLTAFPALLAARTFLGGGLGEELGWRGFALPALERRWSPLIASLLIGGVWLVWHVPAYLLDPASQEIPFAIFGAFVLASSVVLTFVYDATGGELLPVVFLHASLNASAELMQVAGLNAAEERAAVVGVTLALGAWATALTPWLLRRRGVA